MLTLSDVSEPKALTLSVSAMNQKRMDCLKWQRRRGPELHREQRGKARWSQKDATVKDCTGKQVREK
jgi:hypothetical protein